MKNQICTILGGGGFIGRYLVRNLTKKNYRCIISTRNAFQKGYLKTQATPGSIELINWNPNNFDELKESIKNSDLIFRALMKGNNLDVNSIFDKNASIKDEVKVEAIKSINWCRENIKLSIPKLTNLPKEELDEKKLEELTETFPKFYLHTLETIRRGE